jgi:hypothetical protein
VERPRFAAEAEEDRGRQIFLEMADTWTVVAFEESPFSYQTRFASGVDDERAEQTPQA